jgi:hypothetical protein
MTKKEYRVLMRKVIFPESGVSTLEKWMKSKQDGKRARIWIWGIVLIAGLNFVIYAASLPSYLLPQDDFHHVTEWTANKVEIRTPFLKDTYGRVGQGGHYRPLEVLSHVLDDVLWDGRFWGRHLTNICLHIGCSTLVLLTVSALSGGMLPAIVAAVIFSVHPAHQDAVCWLSGRTDVIGAFFGLASVYLYTLSVRTRSLWAYVGSLLAFFMALMAKEIAFAIPFVISVLGICWLQETEFKNVMSQLYGKGEVRLWKRLVGFSIVYVLPLLLWLANAFSWRDIRIISGGGVILIGPATLLATVLLAYASDQVAKRIVSFRWAERVVDSVLFFVVFGMYWLVRLRVVGGLGGYYSTFTNWSNPSAEITIASFARDAYGLTGLLLPQPAGFNEEVLRLHSHVPGVFYGVFLLLVVGLGMVGWLLWRRDRVSLAYYAAAFLSVAPVHNLLLRNTVYDPRYLYFASAWVCGMLGHHWTKWYRSWRASGRGKFLPLGALSVVVAAYGFTTVRASLDYLYSGSIIRKFVQAVEKNQKTLCDAEDIVVVTWPMLHWDTPRHVWISKYLDDIVSHGMGCKSFVDQDVEFYLFAKRSFKGGRVTVVDDSTFVVSACRGWWDLYVLPLNASWEEVELRRVYSRAWRDPHHRAVQLGTLLTQRSKSDVGFQIWIEGCDVWIRDPRLTMKHSAIILYTDGQFLIVPGKKLRERLLARSDTGLLWEGNDRVAPTGQISCR